MRKTSHARLFWAETSYCQQSHVIRAPEIDEIASRSRELATLFTIVKILRGGTVYP